MRREAGQRVNHQISHVRVLYLGGLGRSGTTLLERLLGELPGVCPAGEVVHLWERGVVKGERCGCGEPFHACTFWRAVGKEAFGGWDRVDTAHIADLHAAVDRSRFVLALAAPRRPPAFQRTLDEYASCYLRVYRAIRATSGCGCVIDSSKNASLAFCLRSCPGLDLRVVHVVRDSRAVAYSWSRRVRRPDADTESYLATYSPLRASTRWNLQNGALHLLARLGTPVLRVAYEDLVAAPDTTLRRVAAFAGLSTADGALRFLGGDGTARWADLRPAHTASGNPLRFQAGRIRIRADDRWRAAMPAGRRRAVTALTLPLLVRYGYARGRAPLRSVRARGRDGATPEPPAPAAPSQP